MKRRDFIELSASAAGGLLSYLLSGEEILARARQSKVQVPLRFFSKQEAKVIEAASERIFPGDESGPGATQAGVVVYIDRQLAGPYGSDRYRYTRPPFVESQPGHGYQGRENPQETYRAGIPKLGRDFISLDGAKQDERLRALERTHFFQLLRQQTIEGMFCDPMHGGNAHLVGWRMLQYPGPQMSYRAQMGKFNGTAYRRKPESLGQILGYSVTPWEDEQEG